MQAAIGADTNQVQGAGGGEGRPVGLLFDENILLFDKVLIY